MPTPSVHDPRGILAAETASLGVLMFALAGVVFALDVVLLLLAIFRRRQDANDLEPRLDQGRLAGEGGVSFIVLGGRTWNLLMGRGRGPTRNPWAAGTLDWATELPPPDEGYRRIPIVSSGYPLWEQSDLDAGDPETMRAVASAPALWLAQRGVRAGQQHWPRLGLGVAFGCGVAFLMAQVATVYVSPRLAMF